MSTTSSTPLPSSVCVCVCVCLARVNKVVPCLPSGVSPLRGRRQGKQTERQKEEEGTQRTPVDKEGNDLFLFFIWMFI